MSSDTHVPFGALGAQNASLEPELRRAFERVVASSGFILGDEVANFEEAFAAYCGTTHCVGVSTGTAALTVTLKAAGIGSGDEVIVPAHTFVASGLAVVHCGATPVLCDVHDADGLIDSASVEALISPTTAAIVAVHLYGRICEMEELRDLARRKGLFLLEDSAQAHGARTAEGRAGSLGDAGAFSFYPGKNLGALGDGGAICTNDPELAARARQLRDLGRESHGRHVVPGTNDRLDGLQAAFLRVKLDRLDAWNKRRRRVAAAYNAELPSSVVTPSDAQGGERCVFHLFPIRVAERDALRTALSQRRIETGIHYSPALHEQPALEGAAVREPLTNSTRWAAEELSLPIYPELTDLEVKYVVEGVTAEC